MQPKRMMVLSSLLFGAVLAYCSSPAGPKGPVLFGLISGDHQQITAGADSLLEPVVGQAYRDESGGVAFRLGPAPLEAQTTIGTGVPNILTCAAPVGAAGLVAYVQCANTDSQGFVRYWFQPGTIATDSACAEIRATPSDQPEVLATTCAVVAPGPMVGFQAQRPDTMSQDLTPGDTIDLRALISGAFDQYVNAIPLDTIGAYPDSDVGWAWFDYGPNAVKPTAPSGSGWATVVPDPAALGWTLIPGPPPSGTDYYRPGLVIWLKGMHMGSATSAIAFRVLKP